MGGFRGVFGGLDAIRSKTKRAKWESIAIVFNYYRQLIEYKTMPGLDILSQTNKGITKFIGTPGFYREKSFLLATICRPVSTVKLLTAL